MSNITSGISIDPNTKFWLYTISQHHWEYLCQKFHESKNYISSFHSYPIKKGDVVLIYQKDTKKRRIVQNGLVGIAKISSDMKFNDSIKVFKDNNMNKQ